MPFDTSLTRLLSIEHPLILAPMGFVSGGALAGAVSAAGGFGIIGGGYAYPDWLGREFGAAGSHRVGCGFITWASPKGPRPAVMAAAARRCLWFRRSLIWLRIQAAACPWWPLAGSLMGAG